MNYTTDYKYYKQDEIQTYINDYLEDHKEYIKENLDHNSDIMELHNEIFNMDYYIIGYYNANQWLKDRAFDCIGIIQEYEKEHFGEVHTDLSSSEKVVNMYAYIVGQELLENMYDDLKEQDLVI